MDESQINNQNDERSKQFTLDFIKAIKHFFVTLGYFLFVLPFGLWCKSIQNLGTQSESGSLRIGKNSSPWPFFSFMKTFFLEFLFDALSFISYPLGALVGVVAFFVMLFNHSSFGGSLVMMLGIFIAAYYLPITFAWCRDSFQLFLIMPIRKFLSWLRKPAQHLDMVQKIDMDIKGK